MNLQGKITERTKMEILDLLRRGNKYIEENK